MRYETPVVHLTNDATALIAGTGGNKSSNTCRDSQHNHTTAGAYEIDE